MNYTQFMQMGNTKEVTAKSPQNIDLIKSEIYNLLKKGVRGRQVINKLQTREI